MATKKREKIEIDQLTGLLNRQGFYNALQKLLDNNPQQQYYLIYLNIRKMKIINSLFGHQKGDEVLIHFSEIIKTVFNEDCLFSRMDRDNFVCCVTEDIITNESWKRLFNITYNINDSEYHFYSYCGLYKITNTSLSIESMVDRVQEAMKTAKNDPSISYAWYDENKWSSLIEEQQLCGDFYKAIAKKEFKVYYQPICLAKDGRVISAEALVRWQHPEVGLIMPGAFVPLFEKNGMIRDLDRYIFEEVCRMQRERIDNCLRTVPVSVNFSRMDFYNQQLCKDMTDIINKYDLPTSLIKIEITESTYATNPQLVLQIVKEMHDAGFVVLMDDFGSGYSSLNVLKDLPFDVLKIDMKFMSDLETSHKAPIILGSVIHMAKWLKLEVIAEGVETKSGWDYLKSMDCDQVQGYYFYKPMPENLFMDLLNETKEPTETKSHNVRSSTIIADSKKDLCGSFGVLKLVDGKPVIHSLHATPYSKSPVSSQVLLEKLFDNLKKEDENKLAMICEISKSSKAIQKVRLGYQIEENSQIYLDFEICALEVGNLYHFTITDSLTKDDIKIPSHSEYFEDLFSLYDKIYLLDYETGLARVLYTSQTDRMKKNEDYYFMDFFDKFAVDLEINGLPTVTTILKNKDILQDKLNRARNHSVFINYKVKNKNLDFTNVSACIFQPKQHMGKNEYLCCIKKRLLDD